MNKERLLELAAMLRGEKEMPEIPGQKEKCVHFNMKDYLATPVKEGEPNWCGTEACLAGLAILRWAPERLDYEGVQTQGVTLLRPEIFGGFAQQAKELLELDNNTASELFEPYWIFDRYLGETRVMLEDKIRAAKVLEKLVETGEVDWGQPTEEEEEESGNY